MIENNIYLMEMISRESYLTMFRIVLYCIVKYYIVLYCIVLYRIGFFLINTFCLAYYFQHSFLTIFDFVCWNGL
jgi:hypothetical protein